MTQMSALHEARLDTVLAMVKATGARSVLDLGCGSGSLLFRLLGDPQFERIIGLEQSGTSLRQAREMLAGLPGAERLNLILGSYLESESAARLVAFDIAVMVETIEHVRPEHLSLAEHTVFGRFRPEQLLMTTPNKDYNPLFDLAPGEFREPDHKFEWGRERFRQWARGVADRQGYRVRFGGIGDEHPELGQPTQTALFEQI